jgi:hypothetical protein
MKKMVLLLFISLFAADASSQVGIGIGTPGVGVGVRIPLNRKKQRMQNIENKVQQMRTDLNLDSAQVVKVRGLLVEHERKKSKGTPMSREEFNGRMDEILIAEQKERFKELHKQKRQGRTSVSEEKRDSTEIKHDSSDTKWDDVYK